MNYDIIIILGPTASGKTRLAANLARIMGTEIISVDSRQVYREMNIGTGKDYHEFTFGNHVVPTHLIDILEAGEKYHIDAFRKDFFSAVESVHQQQKIPIACGGTGLYLDAVLHNFEYTSVPVNEILRSALIAQTREELLARFNEMPVTAFTAIADTSTHKRLIRAIEINTYLLHHSFTPLSFPKIHPIVFGLDLPVDVRRNKITVRLNERMQEGLIDEVRTLRTSLSDEQLEYYGLEYKFITRHLKGNLTYDELISKLTVAIQQFAKRQMTYFRKMEREGLAIHWIDATKPPETQLDQVKMLL